MTNDILDGIGGQVIAHREPVEGEFFRVYTREDNSRWHDQQKHAPALPPAPKPVKVTLDELLEQYHTPEQFAAIRRADELAKVLAIGDPQGVLTNETDEELAALEAIGQFFFLQRIKGGLIDLSTTKLFDEAAKLGVYGDNAKASTEVTRLKEGKPAEKSETP